MRIAVLPLFVSAALLASCTTNDGMMNHDMNGMQHGGTSGMMGGSNVSTPRQDIDLSGLPDVQPSQIIEIQDGDVIDLDPQMVMKTPMDPETGDPRPQAAYAMYAYNGQFPGPTLKVKQGSTFTVRMTNEIDQPTTLHWHGIRLDNRFDGAAGVTQDAVEPGDSFTYEVTVPDDGVYWYHPHVREDVQQDLGLYGALWVTPTDATAYGPVHAEEIVFLDDILLGDDGAPVPHGAETSDYALMGRFGNTFVINGMVEQRFDTKPVWDIPKGSVVRFALINAASTRTFRIEFQNITDDHITQMKRVGGDSGRYAEESLVDAVILSPSERAIVEVSFDRAGQYVLLHSAPDAVPVTLATVYVSTAKASPTLEASALRSNDDIITDVGSLEPYLAKAPDETLHLSVTQDIMSGMNHGGMMNHGTLADAIEWEDPMPMMNAMATKENTHWEFIDEATQKKNMDIRYTFAKGDKVKIRIINDAENAGSDHPMQHPVHFHGQRFLVLAINGKPVNDLVWKDTVLVSKNATVDILLDASNPGDWMFHCHIAEHLTAGMMGMFTVK